MAFAISAGAAALLSVAGAGLVGASIYNATEQKKNQSRAQAGALKIAKQQARDADIAFNAANRKRPTPIGPATAPGLGSTMLTGASGVDPAALLLGRNTLLGA